MSQNWEGFFIPRPLRESLSECGEEGEAWAASLPARVAELGQAWSFIVERVLDTDTSCSWVALVRTAGGEEVILKMGWPHEEARWEAAALGAWRGNGAVRLLNVSDDGFAHLLEHCVPAGNLWSLPPVDAAEVAAALLRRLWIQPATDAPFALLAEYAGTWSDALHQSGAVGEYGAELIEAAERVTAGLIASEPRRVLLHGDFHPGNALSAQREPWLAIDPKPLVGEPAYDLAQWLGNRAESDVQSTDPVGTLRGEVTWFADRLGLDAGRIAAWAFAKSLAWNWGPAKAWLLREVAGV